MLNLLQAEITTVLKMIALVFRHEAKDLIRDSATLKTMAILMVFMPILYSYIIGDMGTRVKEVLDKEKRLGYVDHSEVQRVLPWLQQQGVIPVPIKALSKEVFDKENLDAVLLYKDKDELDVADPIHTQFEVWTNGTNEKKAAAATTIQKHLLQYGSVLARQNLIMAGAAPQLLQPLDAEVKALASSNKSGFVTYDLMVALLGMALFFSTLHVAVDTTAGERERMTLESLLYTAAPRSSIVVGKFLFVASVAIFGMLWTGLTFWVVGEVSIFQELLGRTGGITLSQLLIGVLIMSPLAFFVSSLQIMIGSFCNSVKQAQAYNSISGMISLPLSFLFFLDQMKGIAYTPIFGQGLAYRKVLQGEDWDHLAFISAQAITVAITLVLLGLTLKRFQSEKIILTKV
ncbi:MAG: ABC transporter permease [Bdellovibrionota bacterium]